LSGFFGLQADGPKYGKKALTYEGKTGFGKCVKNKVEESGGRKIKHEW
jgi:hypothetical protein